MKVWITKYALTEGILERELISREGDMATVAWPGGLNGKNYLHGNDWHVPRAAALRRADEMRQAKIKALTAKLKKLEALRFT